ncbi:hypothetical protein MES4922_140038 [Mesorhizobium ventifaucium]|uniref:DUF1636 domain-containing protein n=1 Tax=Mesorhizobium ventifaucium TaxID=666020 RepID=A0ABN8JFA7_9HYPH|nr:hypothetical protein MES4922_140038 [Mesorhizobium ventifaucium]
MNRLALLACCRAKKLSCLLYGPEPIHEGEALAKAIIETVERLNQQKAGPNSSEKGPALAVHLCPACFHSAQTPRRLSTHGSDGGS